MPVNHSPILYSQEIVKRKKPPACDSCKARRVLCHPTTDGTPCPRCLEKGTKCTTSPVARGRPPKPNLGMIPAVLRSPHSAAPTTAPHSASEEPETHPSDLAANSSSLPPQNSARYLGLSPELVHHLFECFIHLPQFSHPMFRGYVLRDTLSSNSWQIDLLPPQLKVLAYCVVALSASISFDHAIVGPGTKPVSLGDRSVFTRGADLREYGVRREPMYRALCAEALRLASDVGVLLEPSEDNAVSCFMLQFLENARETRSRPFAVQYLNHVRVICESWGEEQMVSQNATIWTTFLLMEALETTLHRQPILVSHHDQLLITGRDPLSLQNLFVSLQSAMQERKEQPLIPFTAMRSYFFHVTRLARDLYEKNYRRFRPSPSS
ncbi:Zn(2)-C6 fungal-type transcriptional factor [Mycena venus]|uniref:Zn(2)-C6 fungal-type transcriptional factor n=1 Tax=Mycena venus TaxID=2733690 RepID=A0A8H7DHJ7_9AGAR|nr:Zn(2)-C6 fungal-type transcriptional factor [Mycena venus]